MSAKKPFKTRAEKNRRSEKMRRFPMQIENGEILLRERRLNPDRRRPGLQTQELKVSSEEFATLFEAYRQHG